MTTTSVPAAKPLRLAEETAQEMADLRTKLYGLDGDVEMIIARVRHLRQFVIAPPDQKTIQKMHTALEDVVQKGFGNKNFVQELCTKYGIDHTKTATEQKATEPAKQS